ncbi:CoA-acylating methylmalonate-semialdehyde dehydrogenase [uncultured Desulfovibrio sp.]|uniref:CoA-acylating methylmalonate-semialdehyde dehydrogenase n=1 Tax=uncultured Desulfovibrio sp. TaxID=167968 RepID=UPI00262C16C1|nr:CoA-acylating methylmalonate-semialdehyde dehydrogenase [uncultured Desulfovibrio sp.]
MDRFYTPLSQADPIGQKELRRLKLFINGQWVDSASGVFRDAFNPSTGNVIAKVPACTTEEMDAAVAAAKTAYPSWSDTPVHKRCQVLFNMRHLVNDHKDELIELLSVEQGKTWPEAAGDVLKALEVIDFACGMPQLMKGESLMNVSKGYDTVLYRESMGVFLGLVPWNFPAMIPHGWMIPLCIASGNTFVLKAASSAPQSALRFTELWREAGLPDGVLNVVTCNAADVSHLINHPDIVGVSFVGSTSVGEKVYAEAAAAGKRVQCLGEAKNHALVLNDAVLDRTAAGIINAFCGCAGERCMALPVIVAQEGIADALVQKLVEKAKELRMGPAWDRADTTLGPLVNARHKESVLKWIETGLEEGAVMVLDGRKPSVAPGCENGFFVGPTILDHVKPGMSVGEREVFGPVLCIKRVKTFEEGLAIMNANPYANGSVIYTSSGYYARQFARYTDGGQVGVNVGIPVPVCCFGFTGHKRSFIGDLHVMGSDGVRFYTESKNVTSTWFLPDHQGTVDTWDGMLSLH